MMRKGWVNTWIALLLALAALLAPPACGSEAASDGDKDTSAQTWEQDELDALVENGLAAEVPPAPYVDPDEEAILAVKAVGRGVGYGSEGRSIDIAAWGDDSDAVFAEVKNWSKESWETEAFRDKVLDQLGEHNKGILEIAAKQLPERIVMSKLLMVAEEGFEAWPGRTSFEAQVNERGWTVVRIPRGSIPRFEHVIDGLR